ncbi:hypothetical protein JCM3775_002835 [Rhodotorula graminis]
MSANGHAKGTATPSSPVDERSPLLHSPPPGSTQTLSPARPSYRQRALSRASGNPIPLTAEAQAALLERAPERDDQAALDAERALYRARRARRVRQALLACLGLVLVAGIVLAIVLPLTIGRRGGGGGGGGGDGGGKKRDTPDMTHLPPPGKGTRNPSYLVTGWNGAVASEEQRCSQIGVEILRENGTAVDAAIATALCVGVVNSFSSGIGGGGFMVIRPPSLNSSTSASDTLLPSAYTSNPRCTHPISIDFREAAPARARADMFTRDARPDDPEWNPARASKVGGLAVGVPGELRGFEAAYHACGGGVSWARLFAPAAELAREFAVGKELSRRLNTRISQWTGGKGGPTLNEWIRDEDDWASVFMREHTGKDGRRDEFLREGDIVRRQAYGDTLERLGRDGASAFYEGDIADALVETTRAAGGILTRDDMRSYRAVVRRAEEGVYRGRRYYTGSYPSGGPILRHLLNVLDGFDDFAEAGQTSLTEHRFIEALKFAFAARTSVGDPPFIHNDKRLAEIPTRKFADAVRANITDDRTHHLAYYNPQFDVLEDHGTTHMSTMDQWGGAVALTSTVNLIFGSRVLDAKTGIILNDEMDDFATPGIPDAFGLRPSPFNYPEGGKRPLSSTSPFIMDQASSDAVWLTMGGSGGSRIFGAVAQTLLNLDWGHDLASAVELPRVHHQLLPEYVSVESTFRTDILDSLRDRGHNITLFDINVGIAEVQAVLRDEDGKFFATSDSRKNGIPAAF